LSSGIGSFWAPATDLYESPQAFYLYVDLPGVSLEDVEVEVEPSGIRLRGRRGSLETGRAAERLEIRTGTFERELELPEKIDTSAVSAVLKDGVLRMVLPKLQARAVSVPIDRGKGS